MPLRWALLAGLAFGIGLAWWWSRDTPEQAAAKRTRAEQAAAANAEDAKPVLYRWVDDGGVVHLTDQPPKGRKYRKIDMHPQSGIQVDGRRP